jgi:hypothetical protein
VQGVSLQAKLKLKRRCFHDEAILAFGPVDKSRLIPQGRNIFLITWNRLFLVWLFIVGPGTDLSIDQMFLGVALL